MRLVVALIAVALAAPAAAQTPYQPPLVLMPLGGGIYVIPPPPRPAPPLQQPVWTPPPAPQIGPNRVTLPVPCRATPYGVVC